MSRPRLLPWALCLAWLVAGCCGDERDSPDPNDITDPTAVVSGTACTVLAEIPGPEDFVVQKGKGHRADRLLVSSQDRRSDSEGAIYRVSLRQTPSSASQMELRGRGDCSFRPHGVYLRQGVLVDPAKPDEETRDLLYVINHHDDPLDLSADRSCVAAGVGSTGRPTSIEVLEVGPGSLTMIERLTDDLLDNGNDLVVDDDGAVYVTVPASAFKLVREPLLRAEYSKVIRSADGGWSTVAHLAGYTNGIELIGNDLVVSTSRKGKIYRFPRYKMEQGNLEPMTTFGEMHDNFTWSGETLILATHTKGRRFLQHASHPGARSPSQVWTLERQEETWKRAKIFDDDGTLLSGVSTAACVNEKLILGQVFGSAVLSCSAPACLPADSEEQATSNPKSPGNGDKTGTSVAGKVTPRAEENEQ